MILFRDPRTGIDDRVVRLLRGRFSIVAKVGENNG